MTPPCDTIVANDSVLDAFKQSGDFDYARELVPDNETDYNYFDQFWRSLEDLLDIDLSTGNGYNWIWWALGALVVIAVGYLIWRNRSALFGPRDADFKVEEITENDINEVDFEQLIAEAEKSGDYLMLCRLRYLQTLKAASDASLVTWRRYKTPTQYAIEWPNEDFATMTNHFLRIRYGHYTADAALAEEMRSRQQTLQVLIADSTDKQEQSTRQEEGGEPS